MARPRIYEASPTLPLVRQALPLTLRRLTLTTTAYTLFVGVDVAAKTASIATLLPDQQPSRPFSITQTPAGWQQLLQRLQQNAPSPATTLVVLEATANYWLQLALFLHQHDYNVAVVNPRRAHNFSKALAQAGKTDALDALMLAQLGAKMTLNLWSPPPAVYHELAQRLAERDDLLNLRQQLRNQLHALAHALSSVAAVVERKQAMIAAIEEQIATIDDELQLVAQQDPSWQANIALLQTIKGIGLITAVALVVSTLNFSLCADAAAASRYAGLVPLAYSSGTSVQGRAQIGHGGNSRLRSALYMASLSASRHNPAIRELYQRLRAKGKAVKVARCAAARKLLHIVWAVVSKQQAWSATYGQQAK